VLTRDDTQPSLSGRIGREAPDGSVSAARSRFPSPPAWTNLPNVTVLPVHGGAPRSRWARLLGVLWSSLLVSTVLLAGVPARAMAAPRPDSGRVVSMDERIELDERGVARVRAELVFDAGQTPLDGPVIQMPRRIRVADDDGPQRYRMIGTSDVNVTSSSGANTELRMDRTLDKRIYSIGSRTARVTGVQRYTITMTVSGLLTPGNELDTFSWPIILDGGPAWDRLTAVVIAPAASRDDGCSSSGTATCQTFASGTVTRFSARDVAAGDTLTIQTHYPQDSFQDVDESYTTVKTLADRFPLDGPDLIGAVVILVIGFGAVLAYVVLVSRDHRWASPVPGTIPPPPGTRVVRGVARHVPQRSSPPDARPAEVGMLIDARPEFSHITATMLDLAVRGFLTIHREEDHAWTFRRTTKEAGSLEMYERTVLKKMFPKVKGRIVTVTSTQQICNTKGGFLTTMEGIERRMSELGWFRVAPNKARTRCRAVGTIVGLSGLLSVVPLAGLFGLGLWSVAITMIGLLILAIIPFMPSRTPVGSAVREQAQGFRSFLADLDPDSVDWVESGNIFGRYLPWTVTFGVSKAWIDRFQELTDEGRYRPKFIWYEGLSASPRRDQGELEALNHLVSDFSFALALAARYASTGLAEDGSTP